MRFEFIAPSCIRFGSGTSREVASLAAKLGRSPLIVSGKSQAKIKTILADLKSADIHSILYKITGEPTIAAVEEGAQTAIKNACDMVIGIGGGSVIDGAKAIAALMTNRDPIMNYLEVIGHGRPLSRTPAPWIAVPTTAGAGAEATRNAVLTAPEYQVKVSLRHPEMLPKTAVIDPELTLSLPPHLTAATGLDALTQVIEPYVSGHANPLTDALCHEAIKRASLSLPKAFANGGDLNAREDMALVSLFGGLALSNAKLGAVHGFAAAMGGRFQIPHGVVCACLLAPVMAANITAARKQDLPSVLERYDTVAQLLTGSRDASAEDGAQWIRHLCTVLKIPGIARYDVREIHFPEIVAAARRTSSIKGNPVKLTPDELTLILHRAM